jgi:hypothetical protein
VICHTSTGHHLIIYIYIYIYINSMDVHGKGIETGNAPVRTYSEKKISIWEA